VPVVLRRRYVDKHPFARRISHERRTAIFAFAGPLLSIVLGIATAAKMLPFSAMHQAMEKLVHAPTPFGTSVCKIKCQRILGHDGIDCQCFTCARVSICVPSKFFG
jgi:hypothetical protein